MFYWLLFVCMGTCLPFLIILPRLMEGDTVDRFVLAAMILVTFHLMVCSVVYRFDNNRRQPMEITMDEILHRYPDYKHPRKRHAKEYHRN